VDEFRARALRDRNLGWVYSADEMYLHAKRPLPPRQYYDSWDLTENGVGSVVSFMEAFREGIGEVPRLDGRSIRLLTGLSMAPFLRELAPPLERSTGARVEVRPVVNEFYGESVTVAGLLAGRDLLEAAGSPGEGDLILVPAEALNADGLFIDSMSLSQFRDSLAPARVIPGLEVTEALRKL
jgi:NifB/MoaA-like Fe-S oxidoreductase